MKAELPFYVKTLEVYLKAIEEKGSIFEGISEKEFTHEFIGKLSNEHILKVEELIKEWVYSEEEKQVLLKHISDMKKHREKHPLIINEKPLTEEEQRLKNSVLEFISMGVRYFDDASELLVEFFLRYNFVYSIRTDKIEELWIYDKGIYIEEGKSFIRSFCRRIMGKACNTRREDRVIDKIIVDKYIDREAFFDNNIKEELPIQNGIFDLVNKKLLPFTPKKIFFSKLPITYDPKAECPVIEKHFDTVCRTKEDVKIIQEFFGFTLWKEYFVEKALMFLGDGRNGKGKTLSLLKFFLGGKNVSCLSLEQLEKDKSSNWEIFGKLVNMSGDIGTTGIKNTGNFKRLIGRDDYTAPRKYRDGLHFVSYAKMVFACNELPKVRDDTDGWWSKWVIVDFPYTFLTQEEIDILPEEEREGKKVIDLNIVKKLTSPSELSGLFNWALIGLDRIREQDNFSVNDTFKEVARKWKSSADSLGLFFDECIVYGNYDDYITKDDFRVVYLEFCKRNNAKIVNETVMGLYMREHQVGSKRDKATSNKRAWEGIKFKDLNQANQPNHSISQSRLGEDLYDFSKMGGMLGMAGLKKEGLEEKPDLTIHKCVKCNDVENVRFRFNEGNKPICDKCFKLLGGKENE